MSEFWISRSEAARRLGVSAQMVSTYCTRYGLDSLSREDKRLPWPETREWVRANIIPELSGSYAARHFKRQQEKARPAEVAQIPEFLRGARFEAIAIRKELREILPFHVKSIEAVKIFAMVDCLIGYPGPDPPAPPAIEWTHVQGIDPEQARTAFEEMQQWCEENLIED